MTNEQRQILQLLTSTILVTLVFMLIGSNNWVHEKIEAKSIPQITVSTRPNMQSENKVDLGRNDLLSPIENEIKNIFGKDYKKAIKIVMCESKEKSDAINDNTLWGGVGVDRGYWQINNIYHPNVSDKCASDIKCSTAYAYRMFVNDHNSFKRWSCGKYLNI